VLVVPVIKARGVTSASWRVGEGACPDYHCYGSVMLIETVSCMADEARSGDFQLDW
jgi:hypothetical protein